jgi:hypothetical protein
MAVSTLAQYTSNPWPGLSSGRFVNMTPGLCYPRLASLRADLPGNEA